MQDWKPVADSPLRQTQMSKHALPTLSPWEPSPRSDEIKEPERVDGPKDTWQATLKEPDLNPAPTVTSPSVTPSVVTSPSTTIWMLDASSWHLTSDFGNLSFFQSFSCVCESFWKILILLKHLLSEILCTFSFISRPYPLLSSLNNPQVLFNPVLLFWNYLSIVHSSF